MTAPEQIEQQRRKRQRIRSIAIGCALAGMVILFYIVTLVRLGDNVANRPM